jgi:hypothetical protein
VPDEAGGPRAERPPSAPIGWAQPERADAAAASPLTRVGAFRPDQVFERGAVRAMERR